MALARREIEKAAAQGADPNAVAQVRVELLLKEADLAWAVATSGGVDTGDQKKWIIKAIDAYEKRLQFGPSAIAYYNVGLGYALLNRTSSAIAAFHQAEKLDDGPLSIKARKEIGRLDPSGKLEAKALATPATGSKSGGLHMAPGKKPLWKFIAGGAIVVMLFYKVVVLLLVGLALLAWGIRGKAD